MTLSVRHKRHVSHGHHSGLIPQAPIHTASLVVLGQKSKHDDDPDDISDRDVLPDKIDPVPQPTQSRESGLLRQRAPKQRSNSQVKRDIEKLEKQIGGQEVPVAVVEQRVSNLTQGAFCESVTFEGQTENTWLDLAISCFAGIVLMTGPFEKLLSFIPKGVLAGLFWYMGSSAIFGSGLTALFLFLIRDRAKTSPSDPLHRVRKTRIALWLLFQLLGFAATFAITNTIAAIGKSCHSFAFDHTFGNESPTPMLMVKQGSLL